MSTVIIPDLSLIALIGVSGSGKSSFARAHFRPTEVMSSDFFRGLVSDDENDQSVSPAAFDALYYVAGKRLAAGRRTVVDATNIRAEDRRKLIELAREYDVLPVAIVLDVPESVCAERNAARPDRRMPPHVIPRMAKELRRGLRGLEREGFRRVHVLRGVDEIDAATITYERLFNDRRELTGPFDVIGDVHGCRSELETLLGRLGYVIARDEDGSAIDAEHPDGRTAAFVGDLVDRGPDTPGVLRLVMGMVSAGHALCVSGNHENKLLRARRGRKVQVTHGLAESLAQLDRATPEFRADVDTFLDGLISHYVLDGGKLVLAHAGLKEAYHGRASGRVRDFALYGDTTGETDEYGLPVRYPWANDYRGKAMVLYGHVPTLTPEWINNTMCLDTGCVFGGSLTALRYPEREVVAVPAEAIWYEPTKPLSPPVEVRSGTVLDIDDVLGKRTIETGYHGRISVRAENAAAAIEIMSRFAVDPRWLVYLPPTMSPPATSQRADALEYPTEAFSYFQKEGVERVVCEEKHMGSRAIVVVAASPEVAARRFHVTDGTTGAIYTRTGRPFFGPDATAVLLNEVRAAMTASGLWDELGTDWIAFDAELLPWSAKAGALLRNQYAPVGAAARAVLPDALDLLTAAADRGQDVSTLLATMSRRTENAAKFTEAYGRYCWPTEGLDGVRIAPFQMLACETENYAVGRDHGWHLDVIDRIVTTAPARFQPTGRLIVDVNDSASVAAGVEWWESLTGAGGEGMVVKPIEGFVRGSRGLVQPGVKCRGRDYLRIIYGPDYTEPANLDRLRERGLGRKRALALREYALGLEALDRLVGAEPLWRIHETVFAVLAMESEPVDPRL